MSDPKFFNPEADTTVGKSRLPHWSQKACPYFVTFRLADSVPVEKMRAITKARREWEEKQGPKPWSAEVWTVDSELSGESEVE